MNNTKQFKQKTALSIVLFLILTFLLPLNTHAADVLWDSYEVPSTRQKERLLDNADLLTENQEEDLLEKLNSISQKWQCNVIVLTVDSYNGSIQEYADNYYYYNGFGADYNDNGILFMLSMEDREWAINTSGDAIYAFTDYGQEYMTDRMLPYLRDGDYDLAFDEYINVCDYFLDLYSQGTPYDVGYKAPRTSADVAKYVFFSVIIGLVLAIVPLFIMASELTPVKSATTATAYESEKGVNLRVKEDRFIRKTLSKTPKPQDTGSKGGSGGGSTTFTSSSGHSHGGSHGHF